jgi:hypothetical protein
MEKVRVVMGLFEGKFQWIKKVVEGFLPSKLLPITLVDLTLLSRQHYYYSAIFVLILRRCLIQLSEQNWDCCKH